jgi:hypothetical protein
MYVLLIRENEHMLLSKQHLCELSLQSHEPHPVTASSTHEKRRKSLGRSSSVCKHRTFPLASSARRPCPPGPGTAASDSPRMASRSRACKASHEVRFVSASSDCSDLIDCGAPCANVLQCKRHVQPVPFTRYAQVSIAPHSAGV